MKEVTVPRRRICSRSSTIGAGDEIRTRNLNLGKVLPYHWATPALPLLAVCCWLYGLPFYSGVDWGLAFSGDSTANSARQTANVGESGWRESNPHDQLG